MKKLKYIFLGATRFSKEILLELVESGFLPKAVFAIEEEYFISYDKGKTRERRKNYNFANLRIEAEKLNVPYYSVDSVPGKRLVDYKHIIQDLYADVILCLGWYYMVPKEIRNMAQHGAWGIHASLLPNYAGGAPLVWAIINGETMTGITLFRMADGVDDGDIIAQKAFEIKYEDTINEVYEKATKCSKEILLSVFADIDNVRYIKQDKNKIKVFPQRRPEDGVIDWNSKCSNLYNFIRAQTLPYPCAFFYIDDKIVKVISAEVTDIDSEDAEPGSIVKIGDDYLVATRDYFLKLVRIIFENKEYDFNEFYSNFLKCDI
ncbi:MAG TPA: methionyl-tRNA formyltransferase [Syntrophales bacterium]|nr:methionyl-tRNA formyltransferase [Syntrophales bacterium]HRR41581.1 methionyl-tRNA formyltransferase [Syntrophales bacterium]